MAIVLGTGYFFLGPTSSSSRSFLASIILGGPGSFTLDPLEVSCSAEIPGVRLHWSVSENVASYILQRKPADQNSWGNSTISATIPTEDQDYFDTDLPNTDRTYVYRLRASRGGTHVFSNSEIATVKSCEAVISVPVSETPSSTSSSSSQTTTGSGMVGSNASAPAVVVMPTTVVPPVTSTAISVGTTVTPPTTTASIPAQSGSQTPNPDIVLAVSARPKPAPTSTPTSTSTQPTSTKFFIGDRIRVKPDRLALNVRTTPFITGTVIGVQPGGVLGTIVGGPSYDSVDKYWFWKVDYDTGVDGWSVEYWLDKVVVPPADTIPPQISITAPLNGATVSGVISVAASSSDNVSVSSVEFYVDSILRATDTSSPYTHSLTTTGLSNASHTVFVRARDGAGNMSQSANLSFRVNNVTSSPADTTPPTISLTSPVASSTVSGTVMLAASASDNVGVSIVEFFVDGILKFSDSISAYSYTWDTTGIANGIHTLFAKARDAAGNIVQSLTLTVNVNNVTTPPVSSGPKLWGAYTGWYDSSLANFESRVEKPVNSQTLFVHWGNENQFPPASITTPLKNSGKTLIIFWNPMDYTALSLNQPRFSLDNIMAGNWDSYITSFASSARAYGGPVIIIPFEEMNGNWSPWSGSLNGNTPAKVAAAYRYVRTKFGNVPNVKFGIALNSNSVPDTAANALELYYPGNDYVDYIGIDGFNFGSPWLSFSQIFDAPLAKLKGFGKPIYIFSMGTAEGSQKPAWITDALTVQIPKHPEIVGWVWFNEAKEQNWLVWSSPASLDAFRAAVR